MAFLFKKLAGNANETIRVRSQFVVFQDGVAEVDEAVADTLRSIPNEYAELGGVSDEAPVPAEVFAVEEKASEVVQTAKVDRTVSRRTPKAK